MLEFPINSHQSTVLALVNVEMVVYGVLAFNPLLPDDAVPERGKGIPCF